MAYAKFFYKLSQLLVGFMHNNGLRYKRLDLSLLYQIYSFAQPGRELADISIAAVVENHSRHAILLTRIIAHCNCSSFTRVYTQ